MFRSKNKIAGKVTFHIVNFIKNYSVFENGMKVAHAAKSNNYRWSRGCEEIKYRKTNIPVYLNVNAKNTKPVNIGTNVRCYYALSFTYNFEKP